MKASHRDLEVSARKREDLESSMRARLESELRKLQETNKNLRGKFDLKRWPGQIKFQHTSTFSLSFTCTFPS